VNTSDVRITFKILCRDEPETHGYSFPDEIVLARVNSVPRIGEEVVIRGAAYIVLNVRYFVTPSPFIETSLPPEVDLYSKKWSEEHPPGTVWSRIR